jgi:hypothetical protein
MKYRRLSWTGHVPTGWMKRGSNAYRILVSGYLKTEKVKIKIGLTKINWEVDG